MSAKKVITRMFTVACATLVGLGFVTAAQAAEHRGCSNASLRGSFGFTSTGTHLTLPAPFGGPFAEVGRQSFDGKGNTELTATLSSNGNIVTVTSQGTYVVNPDCTGSFTLFVLPFNTTVNADFVIDDDGAELRVIATDPGVVESRDYRRQFAQVRNE
jgi:hypothetical protein